MKRNAIIPYLLIMAMGVLLVAGTGEQGEETVLTPEEIYAQNCLACHGENYEGAMGPELVNVGDRLSEDEIREVLVNGRGAMPGNLVPNESLDEMVEWLLTLQ